MEQMMACLLAEIRTYEAKMNANLKEMKEEMRAGQQHLKEKLRAGKELLKKEMLAKMETDQEIMEAKQRKDGCQDRCQSKTTEIRTDANNEKSEVLQNTCLLGGYLPSQDRDHTRRNNSQDG
jgi:phenylalanyl-tRNA synthetase alpha subunit